MLNKSSSENEKTAQNLNIRKQQNIIIDHQISENDKQVCANQFSQKSPKSHQKTKNQSIENFTTYSATHAEKNNQLHSNIFSNTDIVFYTSDSGSSEDEEESDQEINQNINEKQDQNQNQESDCNKLREENNDKLQQKEERNVNKVVFQGYFDEIQSNQQTNILQNCDRQQKSQENLKNQQNYDKQDQFKIDKEKFDQIQESGDVQSQQQEQIEIVIDDQVIEDQMKQYESQTMFQHFQQKTLNSNVKQKKYNQESDLKNVNLSQQEDLVKEYSNDIKQDMHLQNSVQQYLRLSEVQKQLFTQTNIQNSDISSTKIKDGYLKIKESKCSCFMQNSKRYFYLNERSLAYYKSQKKKQIIGNINFSIINNCQVIKCEKNQNGFYIDITQYKKKYYIVAKDSNDR
ncbi:hypothetical protein PPERSA_11982 [Pseudocohnilembus persalinus]|uniref:PH domain-containing protein n=1 Tax=Pseudocohnilembus persalinus TaxID=266149 RepID=A0A0V0QKD4_PSEPJ|nr:hypothetical protein PPERSA_11982 [Pseudocohnilembus persalinus]|eukprot:KRX02642.1 hypothetical protein PPERSA_11982 [Pseudocohnilembus persalinus]